MTLCMLNTITKFAMEIQWQINGIQYSEEGVYDNFWQTINGCDSTVKTIITFYSSDSTLVFSNGNLELNSNFGSNYQWYLNGNLINGENDISLVPLQDGFYYCSYLSIDGCIITTENYEMQGLGLLENINYSWSVFPNPVQDILNVEFDEKTIFPLDLKLLDTTGKILLEKSIFNSTLLNLEDLSSGVYQLQVFKNGLVISCKMIMKNK